MIKRRTAWGEVDNPLVLKGRYEPALKNTQRWETPRLIKSGVLTCCFFRTFQPLAWEIMTNNLRLRKSHDPAVPSTRIIREIAYEDAWVIFSPIYVYMTLRNCGKKKSAKSRRKAKNLNVNNQFHLRCFGRIIALRDVCELNLLFLFVFFLFA